MALCARPVAAEPVEHAPIAIVGLGRFEKRSRMRSAHVEEAQRLRPRLGSALAAAVQRTVLDHGELVGQLGKAYVADFMKCRGDLDCVVKLAAPLTPRVRLAVYGDYQVERDGYRFAIRIVDLRDRRAIGEARFALRKAELDDEARWRRELFSLGALLASASEAAEAAGAGGAAGGGAAGAAGSSDASGRAAGDATETPEKAPAETPDKAPAPGAADAVPELPPLETGDPAKTGGTAPATGDPDASGTPFVDSSALDALARGIVWHGHLQLYAAASIREGSRRDFVMFENRLQLDLESQVGPLRLIGRPQLIYDLLSGDVRVAFRELYAARYYDKVEISVGERILSWGITDFWPVVDILNPRNFSRIQIWRPIDEKLPAPTLRISAVLGRVTLHALGIALLQRSDYQLDQTLPFAFPIPAPPSVPIIEHEIPNSIQSGGGGVAMDLALGSWKASLYGAWARDPLPSIFARIDPATGAAELRVENDRVAMGAASVQGTLDALDLLIKAEAAYYHRVDDRCERATEVAPGAPSCFYLRRVPTARATFGLERRLFEGLDAHLQLIGELTRRRDIPALPPAALELAPGLEPQDRIHPIATFRLQGQWARGDFRPAAFVYWSIEDQDWFVNLDLEYHLADGFALAAGAFWFEGYASDPSKNRFTIAGALEQSSNAYLRATAWF